jgi:hypothetical protein
MSATYDEYKEEALRFLMNEHMLVASVRQHIGNLRAPFLPALKIDLLNENHYRTHDKFVITISGSCNIIDSVAAFGPHHEMVNHARRQRRWAVRKLRDFGNILDAATTRVSSRNGTVYFSYHLTIKMDSHIADDS